jgi:hypothetical protein
MWRYPWPSCPDRSFSAELVGAEVDSWVRRILALKAHQHFGSGPIPLRDGVIGPRVSPVKPISA